MVKNERLLQIENSILRFICEYHQFYGQFPKDIIIASELYDEMESLTVMLNGEPKGKYELTCFGVKLVRSDKY